MSRIAQHIINRRRGRIFAGQGVASAETSPHLTPMPPRRSPLDEPNNSAHAWARYKRLMRWMALLTALVVAVALGVLYALGALVSIHVVIASILGIGLMAMLAAALMGLVFLSSGTGHDEAVDYRLDPDD
jgi:hypothetical protein